MADSTPAPVTSASGCRTHHWGDWTPHDLVAAKRAAGVQVSVVVPARDEAATVGAVVSRVRRELVEEVPLVDEIVVIDSDSADDTASLASAAGATVHRAASVRPELGTVPGKGEAMWKSLFVTSGDVLVFLDADLVEWGSHFVAGLLGPLLTDSSVQLVKGFYPRPLEGGGADEGGRVTELVARPLIAVLFPELAGVVQPLAGEWAVRRDHFASLSVPTGYAVELAALVDTEKRSGIGAVAQVDLGRRTHRHQRLRDLGPMATQLLAAARSRTQGVDVPQRLVLRQYRHRDAELVAVDREVVVAERPPAMRFLQGSA